VSVGKPPINSAFSPEEFSSAGSQDLTGGERKTASSKTPGAPSSTIRVENQPPHPEQCLQAGENKVHTVLSSVNHGRGHKTACTPPPLRFITKSAMRFCFPSRVHLSSHGRLGGTASAILSNHERPPCCKLLRVGGSLKSR